MDPCFPNFFSVYPFFNPLTKNVIDWFEQQSIHLSIKLNPRHQSIYLSINLLFDLTIQSPIHRSIRPSIHLFSHLYIHLSTLSIRSLSLSLSGQYSKTHTFYALPFWAFTALICPLGLYFYYRSCMSPFASFICTGFFQFAMKQMQIT